MPGCTLLYLQAMGCTRLLQDPCAAIHGCGVQAAGVVKFQRHSWKESLEPFPDFKALQIVALLVQMSATQMMPAPCLVHH